MLSPLGTGTARGATRDMGGAGKPEPNAGSWLWRAARSAGKARQLADLMRRGQARSPASHTWRGPCLILPGTSAPATTDTPASIPAPAAGISGSPRARTAARHPRISTRRAASVPGRPPKSRHPGYPADQPLVPLARHRTAGYMPTAVTSASLVPISGQTGQASLR